MNIEEGSIYTEGNMIYWIDDTNYSNKRITMCAHLRQLYVVLLHFYKEKE